jgi:hypothetical protein
MMAKKAKAKRVKRPARMSIRRWGIKNHVGGVWTPETFATELEAKGYLKAKSAYYDGDLAKHKVVPVRVTVSIV